MAGNQPAAGYKFNTFQEIKSHSSILYNERMAILFYMLDLQGIEMNTYFSVESAMKVRGLLKQIYKNIRTLIRNNPVMRSTLNLDTKDPGIYVTDVAIGVIDRLVEYCQVSKYTEKRVYIIIQELNRFEVILKDVLQYYHYFIRPDFRQKPEIDIATEKYKEIADIGTVDELRGLVGKSNTIDFDGLGSKRIELTDNVDYDPIVDGDKDEYDDEEEDNIHTPFNKKEELESEDES